MTLSAFRERLTLILIALLPFHAFLVTFLTKLIAGPGNSPLTWLALWKEGLLLVILALAFVEVIGGIKRYNGISVYRNPVTRIHRYTVIRNFIAKLDRIDACILILILLSIPITLFTHNNWKLYLFGFKYDFIPLIIFFLLRRVEWSENFLPKATQIIIWVGGIVAGYGVITMALPMKFFTALGYSDLHSLYLPDGPIAAFQNIGSSGIRRIQSTFSGPNQFGLWLLVPWSICLVKFFTCWIDQNQFLKFKDDSADVRRCSKHAGTCILIGLAILLSFSRSAWIAAAVITIVMVFRTLPKSMRAKHLVRISALFVFGLLIIFLTAPYAVVRVASSKDHFTKSWQGAQSMLSKPLGQGLGSAGPASNRVSDACVHLEPGADTSWALDRPNLCVFTGTQQVQPTDRNCMCPRVTENWYLQIGVELGVLGFAIFIALTILILSALKSTPVVYLPFLGISIASLFLHAWEGSAVAYTLWILASCYRR